jgi:hypothetical protein
MKAGDILKREKIDVTIIPIPREISAECGIALSVECKDLGDIKKLLNKENCIITEIHKIPHGRR